MIRTNFSPHIFSLAALFTLGGFIINLPFYTSGLAALPGFCALSLLVLWFSTVLLNLKQKRKSVFYVSAVLTVLAALTGAFSSFFELFKFLKTVALPKTNSVIIFAALCISVLFFCMAKKSAIYKYCLFAAIICFIFIVICFWGGIKNFDFKGLALPQSFAFKLKNLLSLVLPLFVLPTFTAAQYKQAKPLFWGVATGFLAVALCFLQSIFTLHYQKDLSFPYLRAVSVISSGALFTRLDGLVYFLFFVTSLIRTTVCIKAINYVAKTNTPSE